jgi:thioredoxin-like negative regulator of GroEL
MPMEPITSEPQLRARIAGPALLVLYGGAHCGVCQALRPRIEVLMAEHFAGITLAYVDCAEAPAVCAQQGVFSLPVLRFYVQGQLALEYGRSFSLHEVAAQMQRVLVLAGR